MSVEVGSERSVTGQSGRAVGRPAGNGVGAIVTTMNKVLAFAGVVLLLVGLGLGFRSVSVGSVDCGSAFSPAGGITPMACDGQLNNSVTLVTVLLVAGVLALLVALVLKLVHDRKVDA
ncbi:hypothetical protein GCM10027269_34400 [Kribbella endophytica]